MIITKYFQSKGGLYNTFRELWLECVVVDNTHERSKKKLALTRFELARFPITDWTEPKRDAITTRPQYRDGVAKEEE